jgi:hypothetical protein
MPLAIPRLTAKLCCDIKRRKRRSRRRHNTSYPSILLRRAVRRRDGASRRGCPSLSQRSRSRPLDAEQATQTVRFCVSKSEKHPGESKHINRPSPRHGASWSSTSISQIPNRPKAFHHFTTFQPNHKSANMQFKSIIVAFAAVFVASAMAAPAPAPEPIVPSQDVRTPPLSSVSARAGPPSHSLPTPCIPPPHCFYPKPFLPPPSFHSLHYTVVCEGAER